MNSQQFESNDNKLRAIIQAYLNSNKRWTANDFRNDAKESDPMEVDHLGKGKGKDTDKDKDKDSSKGKGKANERSPTNKTKSATCAKGHFARDCWSRANQDRTVNEVEGAKVDCDAGKEFVLAIENVIQDVSLSPSGCEVHEDGLVMIDSGASVNVCPIWFGESVLEESDGSVQLRGADGRTLQDNGKRQIWPKIGNDLRQYDFHGVEVTKPILSVSYLRENGTETHLAREPFLNYGDRREPLIKKNGVYFVKAQIVHEVKGTIESRVRAGESQKSCVRTQEIHVYTVEGLQNLKNPCF